MGTQTAMLTQYTQCYEHLREHGRHMWYIPFGTASVIGILVAATFYYIPHSLWPVREAILVIGMALHVSFLIRLIKHRYFARIWARSLIEIEKALQVKHIQLFTNPEKGLEYWYSEQPERLLESQPAHDSAVLCMWVILIVIVILACATPFLGD